MVKIRPNYERVLDPEPEKGDLHVVTYDKFTEKWNVRNEHDRLVGTFDSRSTAEAYASVLSNNKPIDTYEIINNDAWYSVIISGSIHGRYPTLAQAEGTLEAILQQRGVPNAGAVSKVQMPKEYGQW